MRAEQVASQAAEEARRYLAAGVPVGKYLAERLLPWMALGSGGKIVALPPSHHTLTCAALIEQILQRKCTLENREGHQWMMEC